MAAFAPDSQMSRPLVFQLNTRCWLRDLSAAAGRRVTLAAIPSQPFQGWRERGFTHVWLMGVWTAGPRARQQALDSETLRREFTAALPGWTEEDVVGSPYAVAAYTVPRELGGDAGLKKFRQSLHRHGLKLILDFVPNHVGLDHPWVNARPEFFVQSDAAGAGSFVGGSAASPLRLCHGRDPHFAPWTDTAQLDLRRADTRAAVTGELLRVAALCDGLRCDMTMLLLDAVFDETWRDSPVRGERAEGEFWAEAIAALRRQHPGLLLLAEAYWDREPELLKLGFDFAYHKAVTDALLDRPEAVQSEVQNSADWLERGMHFLENHDERRVAERLDPAAHRAAALVMLGLPGMRLLHEGQLEGWKVRTPVQLQRRQWEPPDPVVADVYESLLPVLAGLAADSHGAEVLLPRTAWEGNPTAPWFVLVQWQSASDEFFLVAVNLAPHRSQCYVPLTVPALATCNWQLVDVLGDERHERPGEELQTRGLYLDVTAFAAQLFRFTPLT